MTAFIDMMETKILSFIHYNIIKKKVPRIILTYPASTVWDKTKCSWSFFLWRLFQSDFLAGVFRHSWHSSDLTRGEGELLFEEYSCIYFSSSHDMCDFWGLFFLRLLLMTTHTSCFPMIDEQLFRSEDFFFYS